MKSETFVLNGKEVEFQYDENALGRTIEAFQNRGIEIARLVVGETLFVLETNGEDDDFYFEVVMYAEGMEDNFSDPIYEVPQNKEDAKDMIFDWYQDEINELVGL